MLLSWNQNVSFHIFVADIRLSISSWKKMNIFPEQSLSPFKIMMGRVKMATQFPLMICTFISEQSF